MFTIKHSMENIDKEGIEQVINLIDKYNLYGCYKDLISWDAYQSIKDKLNIELSNKNLDTLTMDWKSLVNDLNCLTIEALIIIFKIIVHNDNYRSEYLNSELSRFVFNFKHILLANNIEEYNYELKKNNFKCSIQLEDLDFILDEIHNQNIYNIIQTFDKQNLELTSEIQDKMDSITMMWHLLNTEFDKEKTITFLNNIKQNITLPSYISLLYTLVKYNNQYLFLKDELISLFNQYCFNVKPIKYLYEYLPIFD